MKIAQKTTTKKRKKKENVQQKGKGHGQHGKEQNNSKNKMGASGKRVGGGKIGPEGPKKNIRGKGGEKNVTTTDAWGGGLYRKKNGAFSARDILEIAYGGGKTT